MSATRLSALDDSFLVVESPTAHMHVGWGAAFRPPKQGATPRFADLRDHIEGRLSRAPRYRQKLAGVPLGVNLPVWVDDDAFDINRHVVASSARRLDTLVDECMSHQLERDRPLWQICISDQLEDGHIGVAGKAHHCMVDGIAAVEIAALLLDPTPEPPPADADGWQAEPRPGWGRRISDGLIDRVREQASLVSAPARIAGSPGRLRRLPTQAQRAWLALSHTIRPAERVAPLNQPISSSRHLAGFWRPLDDLKRVARAYGGTVNDVLLAISAGGARRLLQRRGETPAPLKTMVPVSVRDDGEADELGNRISFVFVDLPCDEPDPVRRMRNVQMGMGDRKEAGSPEGADAFLGAVKHAPGPLRRVISRLAASPRTFNLTVSNIPGPSERMYMLGCELEEAYPVVPISDEHALSIGMTTVGDRACFGLYTDRESLPDADLLAEEIDSSIDELLASKGRLRNGVEESAA